MKLIGFKSCVKVNFLQNLCFCTFHWLIHNTGNLLADNVVSQKLLRQALSKKHLVLMNGWMNEWTHPCIHRHFKSYTRNQQLGQSKIIIGKMTISLQSKRVGLGFVCWFSLFLFPFLSLSLYLLHLQGKLIRHYYYFIISYYSKMVSNWFHWDYWISKQVFIIKCNRKP